MYLQYTFYIGDHHFQIKTDQKLNPEEQSQLHIILTLFQSLPLNGNPSKNFCKFKFERFPATLLKLAANAFDNNGLSVLSIACTYGSPKVVQLLIDFGAKIDMLNCNAYLTPLHCAVFHSYLYNPFRATEIIECLLLNGARVNIKDRENETPLQLAVRSNQLLAAAIITNFLKEKNKAANLGAIVGLFHFFPPEICSIITSFITEYQWKICRQVNRAANTFYKLELDNFSKNKRLFFLQKIETIKTDDHSSEFKSESTFENNTPILKC